MSEEVRKRMEAYRKRKAQFARESDNALEAIRWRVTKKLLNEYPELEPEWLGIEDDPHVLLELRLRVGDYGYVKVFTRKEIENPQLAIDYTVAEISVRLSKDPIRHLLE